MKTMQEVADYLKKSDKNSVYTQLSDGTGIHLSYFEGKYVAESVQRLEEDSQVLEEIIDHYLMNKFNSIK